MYKLFVFQIPKTPSEALKTIEFLHSPPFKKDTFSASNPQKQRLYNLKPKNSRYFAYMWLNPIAIVIDKPPKTCAKQQLFKLLYAFFLMRIRKAKKEDIPSISKLIINTLEKVNAKEYKKRQLEIEKKCHSIVELNKEIKEKIFFILIDKEKIVGVIQLDLNEKAIDRLFLNPRYIGKGLGKRLMIYAENYAKKKGIKKIILYPTEFALEFYKKAGYKITREFMGTRNGGYPVTEMEKKL